MMKLPPNPWKTAMIVCGAAFQVIFFIELFLLHDFVVVDPRVHHITYDNWQWFLDWTPPGYWNDYFTEIMTADTWINWLFQLAFGVFLIYIFIRREVFCLKAKTILLTVAALIFISIALQYYLKYYVDVYRLYMYGIYNEMIALYLLYIGIAKKYRANARPHCASPST